jgi:uncharacterized surface protein with fasciclin (FAS1) repeats
MKTFFSPVVLFLIAALVIAIAASQMPMFKDDAETAPVETAAETTPATEAAIAAATDAATGDVPAAATGTADANGSIPDGSLYGLIAGSADHGTLLRAVEAAGLAEELRTGTNGITLFAPNDAAFAALPEGALDALMADQARLADVLKRHMVAGPVLLSQSDVAVRDLKTLAGTDIQLTASPDGAAMVATADGARATIVRADATRSNGVAQGIDSLLIAPSALSATAPAAETETPATVAPLTETGAPAATDETAPAVDAGTMPAPEAETAPEVDAETTAPAADTEASPAMENETVPADAATEAP